MVTKNSHGWKNGLRNRGQWRFMQVPTSIFPTVFAVTQCQRLACNRYVGPWGAMYWNSPLEISPKKHILLKNNEEHFENLDQFLAKPSTQRLATDSGQVANKFGELFQGKALIIHDAAKSSTDHWRIERQLQIKARGRSNQVECKKFLTNFSDLFQVSENVASQVYFVSIPPEWPHLSLSFSPMLRP